MPCSWLAIWFANQIGNAQLLIGIGTVFGDGIAHAEGVAILRLAIVIGAGFSIWEFSDGFLLAWKTLAEPSEVRWFDLLSALCEGLLGPVLALSAIALSATNQRLFLATILVILAAAIYVAPLAAFFIGIMIYGF